MAVPSRLTHCSPGPHARLSPLAQRGIETAFLFSSGLNSNSNFENSYLSAQRYKNYETSSIGFINLFSIHEKYFVEQ
jgi:hypothetical protein